MADRVPMTKTGEDRLREELKKLKQLTTSEIIRKHLKIIKIIKKH